MTRFRTLSAGALLCAALATCADGGPTDAGRSATLDVRPSFQVDPSLFPSGPIDRVRLRVIEVTTSLLVGQADVAVDPAQAAWSLPLDVDLGGEPSLDVIVEVELYSGSTVEWSGRLGPFMVTAGATPAVRGVEVHRGSLENLDVTALVIQGVPSQLNVGATAVVTAVPTLAAGSTTVPTIFWASSDPSVATVTPTGASVTVTAVGVGSADIVAAAGAADDEVTLAVVAVAPPGFDIEWRGTTTAWTTPSNWSTGQVPVVTDDVYVPASAAVDPSISTFTQVAGLTVESGASLTLAGATLELSGDLDAQGPIAGGGDVFLTGTSTTARGTVQVPVMVSGSAAASGAFTVASLTVDGAGASFEVGAQSVIVNATLRTQAGGALRMTSAAGVLTTVDAFFDGGSTAGFLTAGQLRISGDFLALTDPGAFAASGTHEVVFDGSQAQTGSFSDPGPGTQRFHDVTFDNAAGVLFTSDVTASGTVDVVAGAVMVDDFTLSLGGALVDPAAGLVYAQLRLIGNVSALPAVLSSQVTVDATVTWPNTATISSDLYVLGSLDVATHTLTVAGSATSEGALTVPTGGTLAIGGLLTLESGSTFHVDGAVTAAGRCVDLGATITGTGTHPCGAASGSKQWVGGDAGGPSDWHNANNWFPPGVPGPSDDVVTGVDESIQLSANASVRSLILGDATRLDLAGFTLSVEGDLHSPYFIEGGVVEVTGAGAVLEGYLPDVVIRADRVLSGSLNTSGSLTISDADLSLGGQPVFVAGDFGVTGPNGRLVMTTTSDYLWVSGDATFDGGDHAGLLTEGLMVLQGSLFVAGQSPGAFTASGNHAVQLLGSTAQTVSFTSPGLQQQRFQYIYVSNASGITFTTSAAVAGNVDVLGGVVVPLGTTLEVAGTLALYPGGVLQVDGTVSAASCTNLGGQVTGSGQHPCPPSPTADRTWVGGDAGGPSDWNNANNWSPPGLPLPTETVYVPYTNNAPVLSGNDTVLGLTVGLSATLNLNGFTLSIDGDVAVDGVVLGGIVDLTDLGAVLYGNFGALRVSAPRALSGAVAVAGNLQIQDVLTIGSETLSTQGSLFVSTVLGRLVMDGPGAVLVGGDITFDGASQVGYLTDGGLTVYGDFVVGQSHSGLAFGSTGTIVSLAGSATQTVSLTNPGAQTFDDLYVFAPQVTFLSGISVTGAFYANSSTLTQGGTQAIEVLGSLALSQVTFDGLPLSLRSSQAPNVHTLAGLTFNNMPRTGTQLRIELVGGGANAPLTIASPVFNTQPVQGGYYIEAINTTQTGAQLVIDVTTPMPSTRPFELFADQLTIINWIP